MVQVDQQINHSYHLKSINSFCNMVVYRKNMVVKDMLQCCGDIHCSPFFFLWTGVCISCLQLGSCFSLFLMFSFLYCITTDLTERRHTGPLLCAFPLRHVDHSFIRVCLIQWDPPYPT